MKQRTKESLNKRQIIYLPFKRFLDLFFSFIAIVVLFPFMFVISVCVLVDTGGFPLFRQRRVGRYNKDFLILKFRSMNKKTLKDIPTHLLENPDQYISRFGRFLRRSSIDEIPQFFNIFMGQMSLIGPRPALWNQKDLINCRTAKNIHLIKPGLSGWAQCNGRDDIKLSKKIELDYEYLERFNIWFDIKIFFLSIGKTITGRDVVEGKQS